MNNDKPNYEIGLDGIIGDNLKRTGHFGIMYRGINCVKCPFDYVLYQMIINEVRPDLIIEIGTWNGGSALYLSDTMKNAGIHGEVHTIDIENRVQDYQILKDPCIKRFTEGFLNYDLRLTRFFKKILVIDDGSHHYEDCLDAFKMFNSIVSLGSYYIVEDSSVNVNGYVDYLGGGPWFSIQKIIEENPNFEIDRKWCDFFGTNATFNMDGYLKKKY